MEWTISKVDFVVISGDNFLQSNRVAVFNDTRKEIIRLIENLEVDLAGNFEHDVIIEDEEIFHFSPENMKNLKAFHERVC